MTLWKRGRAVECTGLENRRRCETSVSSNLTASANLEFEERERASQLQMNSLLPHQLKRAQKIQLTRRFQVADIPLLTETFERMLGMPTSDWAFSAGTGLDLPDWYRHGLDPDSQAYKAQQLRLWRTISGR